MAMNTDRLCVPRLWPVVGILVVLAGIGLGVFLRRYRGADRTALALALLEGIGLCLIPMLAWAQCRLGGRVVSLGSLRWMGFRAGALVGLGAGGVAILLLAIRWGIDQLGGPVSEEFFPAFLRALQALVRETATGLPAYLTVGLVAGSLLGLGAAEICGRCAREAPGESPGQAR
jgi:hypothetical protein